MYRVNISPRSRMPFQREHPGDARCARERWHEARGSGARRRRRVLQSAQTAWTLRMSRGAGGCDSWSSVFSPACASFGRKRTQPKSASTMQSKK
jgi:hypothetical protein